MRFTESKIFILTGAVHTGKSNALHQMILRLREEGKTVSGLLNPVVNGKKIFIDLATNDRFAMEERLQEDSIQVGKFTFSAAAFTRARRIVSNIPKDDCDLFIIDEIGKLELKAQGLEPAISHFIQHLSSSPVKNVLFVVRDYLVEDAINTFGLQGAQIIAKEELIRTAWL